MSSNYVPREDIPEHLLVPEEDLPDELLQPAGAAAVEAEEPVTPYETPPPSAISRFGTAFGEETVEPLKASNLKKTFLGGPEGLVSNIAQAHWASLQDAFETAKTDKLTGARKALTALIPIFGPGLNQAADELARGDIASGLGRTAGVTTAMFAAPAAKAGAPAIARGVRGAAGRMARPLQRGAISPKSQTYAGGEAQVTASLEEGILPTPQGLQAAKSALKKRGEAVRSTAAELPQKRIHNPGAVYQELERLKERTNFLDEKAAIDKVQQEFIGRFRDRGAVRNIGPLEAWETKVEYQQRGQKMGAYKKGPKKAARVRAYRAVAETLTEDLKAQWPELKSPMGRYGPMPDLVNSVETKVKQIANNPSRRHIVAGVVGGTTAMAAGLESGTVATLIAEVLQDSALRSKIAVRLHKFSGGSFAEANARVGAYADAMRTAQANVARDVERRGGLEPRPSEAVPGATAEAPPLRPRRGERGRVLPRPRPGEQELERPPGTLEDYPLRGEEPPPRLEGLPIRPRPGGGGAPVPAMARRGGKKPPREEPPGFVREGETPDQAADRWREEGEPWMEDPDKAADALREAMSPSAGRPRNIREAAAAKKAAKAELLNEEPPPTDLGPTGKNIRVGTVKRFYGGYESKDFPPAFTVKRVKGGGFGIYDEEASALASDRVFSRQEAFQEALRMNKEHEGWDYLSGKDRAALIKVLRKSVEDLEK